jgi:hypothetical protein
MAVAALILGILGTLCSLSVFGAVLGILLSIVAVILGILGRKQAVTESKPTGMATAGLVLGIVGTAIGALLFIACAACVGSVNTMGREIEKEAAKEQKERRAREAATPPVAIGAIVTFANDSAWVVSDAKDRGKTLSASATPAATTEGHFVQVTFKITNLTKKEDSLLDLPVIVDGQGRELKPFERAGSYLPAGARGLAMAPLPPSIEKEFVEIYEVPANAEKLQFRARTLAPLGDTRLVDLGM